ncbi:DUF6756 family protein [Flavobacterium hungaricum]|uniref:Uncharacterized protein n=1 Tax=Flavobacterium hungaricum TaxID=2082725 RepID=A0ABR9TRC3_9FLAO|nr:DUF6756 family protein [Flavobacterium hungaricum]MBE8727910.1 hypothetical protein [Flavobacterium hungaricum]
MNKERHLLRKNQNGLRPKIAEIISEQMILEKDFRPLSIKEDWKQIEENIYQKFCHYNRIRSTWLWNTFKLDTFSASNLSSRPETYLDQLIEESETVWYIVSETVNEKNKFWFYEGKIKTIQKIIDESWLYDLYIVSKKYEWLIAINHHDTLIATGNVMPDKLRQLKVAY